MTEIQDLKECKEFKEDMDTVFPLASPKLVRQTHRLCSNYSNCKNAVSFYHDEYCFWCQQFTKNVITRHIVPVLPVNGT